MDDPPLSRLSPALIPVSPASAPLSPVPRPQNPGPPHLVAVDLAAKYSALCQMSTAGAVLDETDSWGKTESEFIDRICRYWTEWWCPEPPLVLAVEDLPHRLPFASLVKQVCRIQGRIVDRMDTFGAADAVLFVPPALWRRAFKGLSRGTGPEAVTAVAAELGYLPPDLSDRAAVIGGKAIARKVATDYCAAFLIARWAADYFNEHGHFDAPGTSRYATALHRN